MQSDDVVLAPVQCLADWSEYNSNCYYASNYATDYQSAWSACRSFHCGNLVSISDQAELDFIGGMS